MQSGKSLSKKGLKQGTICGFFSFVLFVSLFIFNVEFLGVG